MGKATDPREDDFEGWYVVRTKQHGEARALEELGHYGVETYFPMLPQQIKRNRKVVWEDRPMLRGYVLVYVKLKVDFYNVTEMLGVVSFLPPPPAKPCMISERKIATLRDAAAKESRKIHRLIEPEVAKFEVGEQVRITDGPFADFEGTIERGGEALSFRVLTWLFGRATPVTLDAWQIESMSPGVPEPEDEAVAA